MLTNCLFKLVVPSWDCDGQGNCYDPGTGNGAYSSLSSCQSNCVVPVPGTVMTNCYDDELIVFMSSNCVVSWV